MATLNDLKFAYRVFMRAYPYRRIDWLSGAELKEPLRDARVAVVTTAGFCLPDQAPFDHSIGGGDCSYRVIPADTILETLAIAHSSDAFDTAGIAADRNLALPLYRLKALARDGIIGSVAPRHLSFMGSISAPGRLISRTAPEAARIMQEDDVDAVLLTPV